MDAQNEWTTWLANLKKTVQPPKVNYQTYAPTDNEIDNIAYLTFKYVAGWEMRRVDLEVVLVIANNAKRTAMDDLNGKPQFSSVDELIEKFVPALSEYVWDHILSEPPFPTQENVEEATKVVVDFIYGQDESVRNRV